MASTPERTASTASPSVIELDEEMSMLPSQRTLNEECASHMPHSITSSGEIVQLRDGDVEVQYAPVLPCLTVPDRKAALLRPFKLPAGAVRDETLPRKTLGARRRKSGSGPGAFISHKAAAAGELSLSALATAAAEAKDDAPPPAVAAAQVVDAGTYEPLVLWSPPEDSDAPCVQVEGVLCKFLREHQREGVEFMWECVHGLKPYAGNGCILADDMGLGKTLQSITLLYTCLRQGIGGKPTAKRAIVVCPTSLVANWEKEIVKWVGAGRVRVLALAEATREKAIMDINTFLTTRTYEVLIISYETFRIHAARFHAVADSCDLLICDEAHRLKNDQTLTTQALAGLTCRRRVLLSGTPMQNDLDEFWAMVDFTNPNVLGNASEFRKRYSGPILAAREPWATDRQKTEGDDASKELSNIVNQFILRRTNTLLSKHLPPKLLQVVTVKLSPLQRALYDHFLSSKELDLIMAGQQRGVLSCITALRKLVNHPRLIYDVVRANRENKAGGGRTDEGAAGFEDCEKFFPEAFHRERGAFVEMSGKFELTARMLSLLREKTDDRIVIVSCYTQTLDIFQALCRENAWPYIRLDGSTSAGKRQKLVDKFNDPKNNEFVFLLSSKAGGCGLNLIGANRLILFDPDWNPATDLQAAARVWRDGQRKKVYVYRFLAAGTLEEKVFQRQLSKKGLQTIVVEEQDEVNTLSSDDLRNLFCPATDTPSDTHDMLRCPRCRKPELEPGESDTELEAQRQDEGAARKAAIAGVAPPAPAAKAEATDGADDGAARKAARAADGSRSPVCGELPVPSEAGAAAPDEPMPAADTSTAPQLARLRVPAMVSSPAGGTPPKPGADDAVMIDEDDPLAAFLAAGGDDPQPASDPEVDAPRRSSRGNASSKKNAKASTPPIEYDEGSDKDASDMEVDSDEDGGRRGRKSSNNGKGPAKGSGARGRAGKKSENGVAAGSKRRRGEAAVEPAAKKISKAEQRRISKQQQEEQKAFEAAVAAAIKESLNKPLDPVPLGTHRRQLKWPNEDDLKNWSHTTGVDSVADDILRQAGQDLVTFVFGLEVQGRDLSEFKTAAKPASRPAAAAAAATSAAAGSVAAAPGSSAAGLAASFAARRAMAAQARKAMFTPPSAGAAPTAAASGARKAAAGSASLGARAPRAAAAAKTKPKKASKRSADDDSEDDGEEDDEEEEPALDDDSDDDGGSDGENQEEDEAATRKALTPGMRDVTNTASAAASSGKLPRRAAAPKSLAEADD